MYAAQLISFLLIGCSKTSTEPKEDEPILTLIEDLGFSHEDGERISYSLQAELGDGKYVLNVIDGFSGTYVGKHALLVQFGEETISGEKRIILKYLGEDRDAANAATIKSPIFKGSLKEQRQELDDDSLIAAPLIPLE